MLKKHTNNNNSCIVFFALARLLSQLQTRLSRNFPWSSKIFNWL